MDTLTGMQCTQCGAETVAEALFCQVCGAAVVQADPSTVARAPWGYGDMLKAIGLIILGTLIFSIPAAIVAAIIADGGSLEEDPTALTIVLGAGIFLELLMLGAAVQFSVRKYGVGWRNLGVRSPIRNGFWATTGLAIAIVVASFAATVAYFSALGTVGISPDTDLPEETYQSAGPIIIIAVLSLVLAPLIEEVFFRGFIFGGLRSRWGTGGAALGSGVLFAIAHIGNPGTLYLIPPIALVGVIFAFGYAHSGSLAATVVAHFLFNLVSFVGGLSTS